MKDDELSDTTRCRFAGLKYLRNAGILLGLGLGGFFHRIVLHQILGWHDIFNGQAFSIDQLQHQNRLNGFFQLACWILVLFGLAMLCRAIRDGVPVQCGNALTGAILIGAGLFSLVEAIVGRPTIGFHSAWPHQSAQWLYNFMFLSSGLVLACVGWLMGRSSDPTIAV